jgi:hypothetical protein
MNAKTKTAPKNAPKAADKAPTQAKPKAAELELAAVIAVELGQRDASVKARDALAATIRARFLHLSKVTADQLLPVYPDPKQAKTRQNRAADLNAAMKCAHDVGPENAELLLRDALTFGSRLRDDWASACALAGKHLARIMATGTAKAAARPEAMRATLADIKAKRAVDAARDAARTAEASAKRAESQAESAARYVGRLDAKVAEGQDVGDALNEAEKAADAAARAAKDLRKKADAAKAKLPQAEPPKPPTVEAAVQAVKVAIGSRDLPLAALGAIARDLVAKCKAAGAHEAAELIGKAAEKLG